MAVLGIQKEDFGTHWFNLKSKISQLPVDSPKGETINNQMANPSVLYNVDFEIMNESDYITSSYDVSTEQEKIPICKGHKNLYEKNNINII